MASGHNDPKLLYAVSGVKAYHIANGDEQSLTPSGPQTLSLLMVPTSSGFADPSGLTSGNGEEDFYLHLHLPPELDLPMPATTQIYHQPPSSYLIPRWDLGPGSGAFTRLEFPAPNSRAGVQEDVDTFETILAQCTAFLERAPPPRPPRSKAAEAKAREAAGEAPPPYNPASFEAGEAYVQGSASSHVGGRIVLVDEEDGSVIGELSEGFKVVEDSAVRPGTKDPVEITLPEDGSHNISVEPAEYDYIEDSVHPAYKKSTLVSGATRASRLLITTSDYVGKMLQGQADSFTHKTEPVANPVTFTPATHERIRRINQYSSKAAGLSSSTVGSISKVTQNLASNIRRKDGKARGYDKDGNMVESYKPGILNKSLMAFNTIVDGAEQAGKTLLNSTSNSVSTVVGHRWGPDAGEAARNIGGGFKNVGLVYIDVTGVSRRAILKSVAKGMLVGQVKDGGKVYVGGDDGASVSGANGPGKAAATAAYGDSKGKKPSNAGAVPDLAPPNGISVIGDPTVTLSILKMLHEILLSLSGHPSPLLTAELDGTTQSSSALSPSERQLLATAAHLSDLHSKLIKHAARITASHPSTVCRAVATAIQSVHLAALRRTVLEVEAGILRHDPDLVGAYNIVPLTAVIGAFQPWTRRLEWLWEVVQFVEAKDASGRLCWGARAIDRLRAELQSGYRDVEETALTLVAAAETAWLRQVSAWIFYGRLPSAAGSEDFFIRSSSSRSGGRGAEDIPQDEDYVSVAGLLPAFVTPATAKSMLFIGRSLNQIRARSTTLSTASGFHNTAAKLQAIANLTSPLNSANFTGTIRDIRQSLSQDILEQILPLAEVVSTMQLLREFFLLGRGEFAMALTQEADERIRGRWRRAGHLAHDKDSGVQNVTVKSGEVSAALARAWASLSSFERADDGDELLDRARDSLRLQLVKARPDMPAHAHAHARPGLSEAAVARLAASPFSSLLFSVPVTLAVQLPPAVDMVLSASDMQLYSGAHAYLMALRRAHIRLTDLWKLTSLRRHYPGPRGADAHAQELRQRWSARAEVLRGMWTTASAAIFFLGETEAYFQTEVVAGLWRGFQAWLTSDDARHNQTQDVVATADEMDISDDDIDDQDLFPATAPPTRPTTSSSSAAVIPRKNRHDQQTLATGHTVYLDTLVHRLLLTHDAYTRPLYALLVHIDHLVTHVHRLHGLFTSIDLETDAGVVDAFANLAAEEAQVLRQLRAVARSVRAAIDDVVAALEALSVDEAFLQVWEGEGGGEAAAAVAQMDDWAPGEAYRPERVGGLNRLLMQLKFGS